MCDTEQLYATFTEWHQLSSQIYTYTLKYTFYFQKDFIQINA